MRRCRETARRTIDCFLTFFLNYHIFTFFNFFQHFYYKNVSKSAAQYSISNFLLCLPLYLKEMGSTTWKIIFLEA